VRYNSITLHPGHADASFALFLGQWLHRWRLQEN